MTRNRAPPDRLARLRGTVAVRGRRGVRVGRLRGVASRLARHCGRQDGDVEEPHERAASHLEHTQQVGLV